MLGHYLKTAVRNFKKNKFSFSINILGLSVGISATLLIAKYVGFNLSIDNFHQHKANIVLVQQNESKAGLERPEQPNTYWGHASKLQRKPDMHCRHIFFFHFLFYCPGRKP
jgi:hypothetical protein